MSDFDRIEELAGEGIYSGVELEDEMSQNDNSDKEPFDTDSISITPKTVALDTVLRRIKNNTIKLAPDFQRSYVWDKKRKSQLIESMMLKIPLPMFYVSEDKNGVWEVVDGLQRLTTIKDFILGPDYDGKGFKLSGLEFWSTPYDGYDYFNLEKNDENIKVINNIMETELSFIIINPETPEKVKRNIFKRINTGGMRLSNQEIRHALYQGRASILLKSMVENDVYNDVVGHTVKDDRMAGRELILRYLAFTLFGYDNYYGDMDDFLSNTMKALNNDKTKEYPAIEIPKDEAIINAFELGLRRTYDIFGEHSFRKSLPGDNRKTPVNKSLFELWLYLLTRAKKDSYDEIILKKDFLLNEYRDLLQNYEFMNSISRHGAGIQGAKFRKDCLLDLLKRVINA